MVIAHYRQNSYGASHNDKANSQQRLDFYCSQGQVDVFPIAFLNVMFSTGGLPALDLSNVCSVGTNGPFNDTALPDCSFLASDIASCQKRGHIVTLSIGENLRRNKARVLIWMQAALLHLVDSIPSLRLLALRTPFGISFLRALRQFDPLVRLFLMGESTQLKGLFTPS